MAQDDDRRVTLFGADGGHLTVWAYRSADGDLRIDGQDLAPPMGGGEYEYFLTVPAARVRDVCAALGEPDGDVLSLLERHGAEIVKTGEQRWLRSIGIDPGFASWS